MTKPILEVKKLSKSYPNFKLDNINFTLPENCITGFIGTNGSGKTTTIKAILNLIKIDHGTINILGNDYKDKNIRIKNKIGVVLGNGCFYDSLTINEMTNIIKLSYSQWDAGTYEKLLKEFHLNPRQKISTLSMGMRMKFSLLLALSHKADFLIMDEPTSGLDPEIRNNLLLFFQRFMLEGGKGIFFSTHIISDIEKIADQVILIDSGSILFDESKDDLLYQYCRIKGGASIYDNISSLPFLSIDLSEFGFSGIIKNVDIKNIHIPNLIIEKASLEDIMLSHLPRRTKNAF